MNTIIYKINNKAQHPAAHEGEDEINVYLISKEQTVKSIVQQSPSFTFKAMWRSFKQSNVTQILLKLTRFKLLESAICQVENR